MRMEMYSKDNGMTTSPTVEEFTRRLMANLSDFGRTIVSMGLVHKNTMMARYTKDST